MNMSNDPKLEQIVSHLHCPIDNGGITVELITNEHGDTSMEIDTSYYGYPTVSCKLDTIDRDNLKHIIDLLTKHYYKIEK